jgi:hypothetical protein
VTDSSRGFTFAELLVAIGLMSTIVSAVAVLVMNSERLAHSQSQDIDAQQRGRVIAEALGRDLRQAGAGVDRGPMSGPLSRSFSPVFPRRIGRTRADAPEVSRADVISLIHVPDTIWQTTLAATGSPASGQIVLAMCPGGIECPAVRGATLALFDPPGRVDFLGVLGSSLGSTQVRVLGVPAGSFDAGSTVTEVAVRTYYFDAARGELRFYDGDATDQAVVDGVTSLAFEYFGAPEPPVWPKPPLGQPNCLYDAAGAWQEGPTLDAMSDGLAALPVAMFSDGPWCGAGGSSFDADLLRVRRVRVRTSLRSAVRPSDVRPDYRIAFDIAPRNMAISGAPGGW